MHTIEARNVNEALAEALNLFSFFGEKEDSRNGPVLVIDGPVVTEYNCPWERVVFSPTRDANPFFHLMESLWMLAGRNDIEWPVLFNKKFADYSDDGVTDHGAYGYRWRKWFGYDQLQVIINELKRNPNTRRCVLTMWDAKSNVFKEAPGWSDLHIAMNGGKDVPCNTHVYFDCRNGALNMTVCCRSNDIWWGCYGANAVHFSVLQEFVAHAVGVPMGKYRQFSNNFHLYPSALPPQDARRYQNLADEVTRTNLYVIKDANVRALPMIFEATTTEQWMQNLNTFMKSPESKFVTDVLDPFFANVAAPMYRAWIQRKRKEGTGMEHALQIVASDWRVACCEWIQRKEQKKMEAAL